MKKIISIALVALFVASTAFAGFSGDASFPLVTTLRMVHTVFQMPIL